MKSKEIVTSIRRQKKKRARRRRCKCRRTPRQRATHRTKCRSCRVFIGLMMSRSTWSYSRRRSVKNWSHCWPIISRSIAKIIRTNYQRGNWNDSKSLSSAAVVSNPKPQVKGTKSLINQNLSSKYVRASSWQQMRMKLPIFPPILTQTALQATETRKCCRRPSMSLIMLEHSIRIKRNMTRDAQACPLQSTTPSSTKRSQNYCHNTWENLPPVSISNKRQAVRKATKANTEYLGISKAHWTRTQKWFRSIVRYFWISQIRECMAEIARGRFFRRICRMSKPWKSMCKLFSHLKVLRRSAMEEEMHARPKWRYTALGSTIERAGRRIRSLSSNTANQNQLIPARINRWLKTTLCRISKRWISND